MTRALFPASAGAALDASARAALDTSPAAALDVSPEYSGDVSLRSSSDGTRGGLAPDGFYRCGWCRCLLTPKQALWCGKPCRQAAWRFRKLSRMEGSDGAPRRAAYADPPFPGMARKYYRDEPTFAGEVDFPALIASLGDGFDGWALSTSAKSLRDVLPLCPPSARVCAWVKPHGVASATRGLHNAWEPLIVVPARAMRPGVRDWLSALPARGGGTLPGRKPIAFCAFLFRALGLLPGDELVDKFPGTGIVSAAWAEVTRQATVTP